MVNVYFSARISIHVFLYRVINKISSMIRSFGLLIFKIEDKEQRRMNMKRIEYIFLASFVIVACMTSIGLVTMANDKQALNTRILSQPGSCTQSTVPGSSDPQSGEWSMFCGALNHTGTSGGAAAYATPVTAHGTLWTHPMGSAFEYSSPAVVNGHVYVGDDNDSIYSLNANTGALNWSYTTGDYVHSSPVVAGGCVYVGSHDNYIYCLNATTGVRVWDHGAGSYVLTSSPAIADGKLFIGNTAHTVVCVNATSGASNWTYNTASLAIRDSPAVAGGCVYVGSLNQYLYCVNATSGAYIYEWALNGAIYSSPAIVGGYLYVGTDDGYIYCINLNNDIEMWMKSTLGYAVESSPAVAGGLVYVGCDDGKVLCLDATTGASMWNFTTGGSVRSTPAVAGNYVYVGSEDNKIYCLDATTGTPIWSYTTGGWVDTSPAVANGRVYVVSDDANLYCLPMIMLPPAPTNLQATPANAQLSLTWNAPDVGFGTGVGITGYKVYLGTTPGGETYRTTTANVTTYTATGLTNGQAYYFKIAAVNSLGTGTNSTEASASPATVPTPPISVTGASGNAMITLTWAMPSFDGGRSITGYKVYQGTTAGGETLLATIGVLLTYVSTSLTNGQTYYFKIAATNVMGTGANSTEISMMAGLPSAPQSLVATASDGKVILTWAAPSSTGGSAISGYKIYRGTSAGAETLVTTVGDVLTWTDSALTNGQSYYYTVSAINSYGESPQSIEASATPTSSSPATPGYPVTFMIGLLSIVFTVLAARTKRSCKQ